MCKAMQRYLKGDPDAIVPGLAEADKRVIAFILENIQDIQGSIRHQKWLDAITEGKFSFGEANINYIPKGKDSWKYSSFGN
jgi:hypothetical protein